MSNNILVLRNGSAVDSPSLGTEVAKGQAILTQFLQSPRSSTAPDYTIDDLPYYSCRACAGGVDTTDELVSFHSIFVEGTQGDRFVATTSFNTFTPVVPNQGPVTMAKPSAAYFPPSVDTTGVYGRRKMVVEATSTNDTQVTYLQEGWDVRRLNEYVWFCGPLQERLDNTTTGANRTDLTCAGHPVVSLQKPDWINTPGE